MKTEDGRDAPGRNVVPGSRLKAAMHEKMAMPQDEKEG